MKKLLAIASLLFLVGTLAFSQCVPPIYKTSVKGEAPTNLQAKWPMNNLDPTTKLPPAGVTWDPPAYFSCANYALSPLPLRSCSDTAKTACYGDIECAALADAVDPTVAAVCSGPVTSTSGGIHKFVDTLPSLVLAKGDACPAGVQGSPKCYTIKLIETTWQFHANLPPTKVRGYIEVINNIDQPYSYLGPVIVAQKNVPVFVTFINALPTGQGGDLFLPTDTTYMGAGMGPAMNGMAGDPQRPDCGKVPKPAGCFTENRATLHLHGGISPWISDGTAHQWITPEGERPYPDVTGATPNKGASVVNVPGPADPGPGKMNFYWTNQQSARMFFYHDHAWGITRLNVQAGEAAGYLITDPAEAALMADPLAGVIGGPAIAPALGMALVIQDKTFVPTDKELSLWDPLWDKRRWGGLGSMWQPHVYEPAQNPGDASGVNAFGRWMYGPWFWPPTGDITNLPIPNPYYDPACVAGPTGWCEPPKMPATPYLSSGMEGFLDTPVVNGKAYPTYTVDPRQYRFRILNAANDRFLNLQLYVADATGTEVALNAAEVLAAQTDPVVVPTPDTTLSPKGPAWIQLSTEGGFLPTPVLVRNQVITWVTDPTLFNVGNVDLHSLLLAPAERADVIVDFTKFAGKTLILYNDAPAAFPARVANYDYYLGHPDMTDTGGAPPTQPGYGPNTRTVMQIVVGGAGGTAPPDDYNPATLLALQNAFKHQVDLTGKRAGVFEKSQHPIIVGQAAYNTAYGTAFNANGPKDGFARIYDFSMTFDTVPATPNGPIGTTLTMPLQNKAIHDEMGGTFDPDYGRMTGTLGVEVPNAKAFLQQFVNFPFTSPPTEIWDTTNLPKGDMTVTPISSATDGTQIWKITHNGVDTHPIHFHLYDVQLLNRTGWDGFIRTPHATELGWKDTVRISPLEDTFVAIRPIVPVVPFDMPNSRRLLNPAMPEGALLASATLADAFLTGNIPMDPLGEPIDLYNHFVNFGHEYTWHCHILGHEEMDMMRAVPVGVPPKPPTLQPVVVQGTKATLTWLDNSLNETGFTIVRANDLGFVTGLTTIPLGPGATTYVDTIKSNTTYYYMVIANNVVGDTWDYTNPAINEGASFPTIDVSSASNVQSVGSAPTAPAAPSNLVATLATGPQVRLTWKDNSNNETGFVVQRCVGAGCSTFSNLVTLPANTSLYADTAVAAPNQYTYKVCAINGAVTSPLPCSNTSGVTLDALPAAPSGVSAIVSNLKNNTATVTVGWTDNATTETGYRVKRATDVAFTLNLATYNLGAGVVTFSQSVSRTPAAQNFYYCVQSFNLNGASPCVVAIPSPTTIPAR